MSSAASKSPARPAPKSGVSSYTFDWSDLAFGGKKPVRELKAIFVAAPRELSPRRFTQLVKAYLPKGNLVLGLAKEDFVAGFAGQEQFRTLKRAVVQSIIDKVNAAKTPHHIYTLAYFQRELPFLLEKLGFSQVLLVNGSWQHVMHSRPEFFVLAKQRTPYELLSPFADEKEARSYADRFNQTSPQLVGLLTEREMLIAADKAAAQSFDYSFQTGVALGRKRGQKYALLATAFNKVVPFQTYAMHYGAAREAHFSPMHDLNHYDAVHAEVELLVKAQKEKLDLRGTTLFINLLPCPTCARMFTRTDIAEFVYREDHSDGYAVKMLELAGKKVRRLV